VKIKADKMVSAYANYRTGKILFSITDDGAEQGDNPIFCTSLSICLKVEDSVQ
jgi:hypothetical protein